MLTLLSFIGCILAGAVITGNIFGDQRKQLGKKAVFYTWKGINVVRSYVIPSNPNSAGQQTQRSFFSSIVSYGSALLGSIVKTYWKLHAVGMSEFNAFVGWNLNAMSTATDWVNLSMSRGTLLQTVISTAVYSSNIVDINFSSSSSGNQLTTDFAVGVVYNSDNNKFYVDTTESNTRADGTIAVTCEAGLTANKCHAWLFFVQRDGNGNIIRVSDSDYSTVTT